MDSIDITLQNVLDYDGMLYAVNSTRTLAPRLRLDPSANAQRQTPIQLYSMTPVMLAMQSSLSFWVIDRATSARLGTARSRSVASSYHKQIDATWLDPLSPHTLFTSILLTDAKRLSFCTSSHQEIPKANFCSPQHSIHSRCSPFPTVSA